MYVLLHLIIMIENELNEHYSTLIQMLFIVTNYWKDGTKSANTKHKHSLKFEIRKCWWYVVIIHFQIDNWTFFKRLKYANLSPAHHKKNRSCQKILSACD